MGGKLRVAYLTTHYPALSHTFVLREVAALRRLGAVVHTISLRETSGEHLLSPENRAAWETTYAVRPPRVGDLLGAHLAALARHPRSYLATLAGALGLARPGVKGRLWQVFYFGEAIAVWQHCRAREVHHIHAHHASAPADVALLAARFGNAARSGPRTWSLTLHGPNELRDVRWFALAEKARRAEAVVCISEFARSQLMALVDESHWSKMRVVHCGVVPAEYEHLSAPADAHAQVLCVGRLVPEKGHAVLLQAIARLARDGVAVEAVLVGSGPLRARLEQLAVRLGIANRVIFRGALGQEEVRRSYASATLFCSPSFSEGVPVVLMEAMASRRPVIATAISGVRELVADGDTGLLVTPGSAEELARAISSLLASSELRARLASAAHEHVCREFDVDRSAAQLAELFGELLPRADGRVRAKARGADSPAVEAAPSLR
jgi:colanic acid/amylovoran biosynthesis glycosyltransferase